MTAATDLDAVARTPQAGVALGTIGSYFTYTKAETAMLHELDESKVLLAFTSGSLAISGAILASVGAWLCRRQSGVAS